MKSGDPTAAAQTTYRSLEDVLGCKWSAAVVAALAKGVHRPGQLERSVAGISTKVLTERLRKLLLYGLITRVEHSGAMLHVEYHLTPVGLRLAELIEQLRALQVEHAEQNPTGSVENERQ